MQGKIIKLLDDPKLATAIASFMVVLLSWITRHLMKIPRLYKDKSREKRNQRAIIEGGKRDRILNELLDTGAKYIHLVRYHNGGSKLKHGVPIAMSVDMEKTNDMVCEKCATKCRFYRGSVDPIIDEWQKIKLRGSWFDVVKHTVMNPNDVNVVNSDQLDASHRQIWEQYTIDQYHEILVKHKRDCFYCIGLSFCPRMKEVNTQGKLSLAARQMANLL